MQPQVCYRVGKKIFDSLDEANKCCKAQSNDPTIFEQNKNFILAKKSEIRKQIENTYTQSGMPFDKCNCGNQEYSNKCLVHMCTCDILDKQFPEEKYKSFVCDYHTNQYFKNKGCFWCRHSDCSRWYC